MPHADNYYEHLEHGFGLAEDEHHDPGQLDHRERYSFGHYVIQVNSGLAEPPPGHNHRHLSGGVEYSFDFYMHVILSPGCADKDVDCPEEFAQVKVCDKPY